MKNKLKGCMMHQSDLWETPKDLYNMFTKTMGYYDPCPTNPNFDGLNTAWKETNFVNPPYSQIAKWVDKAIKESRNGKQSVLLVPSRTDTKWFHELMEYGCHFAFIEGRLKFGESKSGAPFPSVLIWVQPWYIKTSQSTIGRWEPLNF